MRSHKLLMWLVPLCGAAVLVAFAAMGQDGASPSSAGDFAGPAPRSMRFASLQGATDYTGVRGCPHDQYNLAMTILASEANEPLQGFDLIFAAKDPANAYRIVCTRKDISLSEIRNGESKLLATSSLAEAGKLGSDQKSQRRIEVQRRGSPLTVLLDGKRTLFSLNSGFGRGWVAIASQKQAITVRDLSYQPTEDIVFTDDFTRLPNEPDPWESLRGAWRLMTTREEVAKHMKIPTDKQPEAERSANFFYYTGKCDPQTGDALALTGYDFWDGYHVGASMESSGGAVGLVFYAKDAANYYLLRWWLMTAREAAQPLELVRVENGKETILARAAVWGAARQWYRLEVLAEGGRVRALVDGNVVFDVQNDGWMTGKAGLYERGADASVFDDVSVTTISTYDFDTSEMLGICGGPETGDWNIKPIRLTGQSRETSRDSLEYKGGGNFGEEGARLGGQAGVYWVGDPSWSHFVFAANVEKPSDEGCVGLAVRGRAGTGDLILRTGSVPGHKEPYTQLLLAKGPGQVNLLAEAPGAVSKGSSHEIRLDLTEKGTAEVYLDGSLWLRAEDPLDGAGRPGLYAWAARGASFKDPRVVFALSRDIGTKVKKKFFTTDRFMGSWSKDILSWVKEPGAENLYWHRSDFFDRLELAIPVAAGFTVYIAAPEKNTTDCYQLTLTPPAGDKAAKAELARAGKPVAQADIPPGQFTGSCRIVRDGAYVWLTLGDKELFSYRDVQPLHGPCLAMKAAGETLKDVDVRQYNVKDYLFDAAPTDWHAIGTWEETNRFTCDPRWSFFSGTQWNGLAAIWNKASFHGDVTVEFYAGMRQSGQAVDYPRPGDINVTICAANDELPTGYNTVFAAWDPFWTGKRAYLMRGTLKVAETDRELIPLNRDREPVGERALHGAWYYIKIRKQGDSVRCYFDDVAVMEYRDPYPLQGHELALWTQMNSIIVARVRISYQDKRDAVLVSRPLTLSGTALDYAFLDKTDELKSTVIASSTHPGLNCDFERGLDGWQAADGDQGGYLTLDTANAGAGKSSLKLTNANSGGTFGAFVSVPRFQPFLVEDFGFMYRVNPDAKVNFYLKTGRRSFYIRFTGPEQPTGDLICLGRIANVKADGKWHSATFPLAAAMCQWAEEAQRTGDIDVTSLQCDELRLGNYHEGYLRAGFGGNPQGASLWLDDMRLASVGRHKAKFTWFDSKQGASRAWSFSYGAPADPGAPNETSASDAQFEADRDGLWYFNLKQFDAHGIPIGIRHQAFYAEESPVKVAEIEPRTGAVWGGDPIRVTFEPFAAANVSLKYMRLKLNGVDIAYQPEAMRFDWEKRQLAISPQDFESVPAFKEGDPVNLTLSLSKYAAAGNAQPTTCEWNYVYSTAADRTPPTAVALNSYPLSENFESARGVRRGDALEIARKTWGMSDGQTALRLDSSDPASGRYCMKVLAMRLQSYMTLILKPTQSPLHIAVNPLLVFDYKMPSATHVNIYLETAGGAQTLHFTDTDPFPVLGSVPEVVADETWHHAEIDLRQMLAGVSARPEMMKLTGIRICDQGYMMAAPGTYYCIDNVALVPAISASKELTLDWTAQDTGSVKGYSYHWSANPGEDPDDTIDSETPNHTFTNLPTGTQYFHIRAVDAAGNWGPSSHYRFTVEKATP